MTSLFKHFFPSQDPGNTDSESAERRLAIATCVILLEAARADNDFSSEEWEHILDIVQNRFGLSREEAEALIEEARLNRDASSDLWHFTHAINERCSNEEKTKIVEDVWRVIYADNILDGHEDKLAHKLQDLLNLTHKQLIDAKMRAKQNG